jgi:hypothetical protein
VTHADKPGHADMPLYPQMAGIAHITGTVQVEVTIRNGVMANPEVKSPAPPMLVNATLENLRHGSSRQMQMRLSESHTFTSGEGRQRFTWKSSNRDATSQSH